MYVRLKLCNMKVQTMQKISCNFREKTFQKINIHGARFNSSGTPLFELYEAFKCRKFRPSSTSTILALNYIRIYCTSLIKIYIFHCFDQLLICLFINSSKKGVINSKKSFLNAIQFILIYMLI